MLNLAEELFLIALNDEKGSVTGSASVNLPFGLAGAILADLALLGKVSLVNNQKLTVVDDSPLDDEVLNVGLQCIAASERLKKVGHWINTLSSNKYCKKIPEALVASGILRQEKKQYFWVIPYVAYPLQDASAKYWIKQNLRAIVLAGEKPNPRRLALLSLLKACEMNNLVFTKDERKQANRRITELIKEEVFGQAVAEAIQEIEAAAAAAVIAATAYS